MPTLKSSKKSLAQNHKAQLRNRSARTAMRTAIKAVRAAADRAAGQQALTRATSLIDKTAKRGVLHSRTASRYKSRLSKLVQKLN